jgi:hypothetical protein
MEKTIAETMGHPEMHTGGKKKGGGDEKEGRERVRREDWRERNSRRTRADTFMAISCGDAFVQLRHSALRHLVVINLKYYHGHDTLCQRINTPANNRDAYICETHYTNSKHD